jgi:spermidine/putrescine transport system permease protein
MFGSLITSEFGMANNWPYGAALSVAMLLIVLVLLAAVNRLARTDAVLE